MAAEIEVPHGEYVHGYLLMNDQKMSKSLGNVIDPFEIIEVFGADALRFYLFREVAFGQDGSVSTEGFETRYTTELANELGNLANRTHSMVGKYRDGVVPTADLPDELVSLFDGLAVEVCGAMDRTEISGALEAIWVRIRALNRFVQDQEPWKLAKDPAAADQLDSVLYGLTEGLRVVGVLLLSILPEKADRLLVALGAQERSIGCARFGAVGGGATLGELQQLFPRVEREPA
jgi:methionyl-tRNA synthetase